VDDEEILLFVRNRVPSAWTLELLLLLHRDPQASWSREALARELRGTADLVAHNLSLLESAGLVAAVGDEGYAYRPGSAELADRVTALAALYAQKPVTILRTIFTAPNDRVRSHPVAARQHPLSDLCD
jgi:hypothetical protein